MMSYEYNQYLKKHRNGVQAAAIFMADHGMVPEELRYEIRSRVTLHDQSKERSDEYLAYDAYFYDVGTEDKTLDEVKLGFDYAWLIHMHRNDHHWQHWVLHRDEGETLPLKMPEAAVYEMICDWWSFSLNEKAPEKIFSWYDENKDKMVLHADTRDLVDDILTTMYSEIHTMTDEDWDMFYKEAGVE